jgi:hypothetical protein
VEVEIMPSEVNSQTVRAGAYARYSSDNQRDASIDDQIRVYRAEIERHVLDARDAPGAVHHRDALRATCQSAYSPRRGLSEGVNKPPSPWTPNDSGRRSGVVIPGFQR